MANFCGECGSALAEGATFCGECGARVATAAPATGALAAPPEAIAPAPLPSPSAAPVASTPTAPPTPAAPAPTARYAGLWRRLFAYLLDVVLLAVVFQFTPTPGALNVAISVLYFVVGWALGGTLGMRALAIRLVDGNGRPPGPARSVRRLIGLVIAAVPAGLGLLWIAADRRKQGWHDKIAGTFAARGAFAPAATELARGGPSAGGAPGIVVALLVLLTLLSGLTAAAGYYLVSPELPPGGVAAFAPSVDDVTAQFPVLAGATDPLSPPPPDQLAKFRQIEADHLATSPVTTMTQQDRGTQAQLQSTGLPVSVVTHTTLPNGQVAMVVGLNYDRISSVVSSDGGFSDSVNSFVQLAKSDKLNTAGAQHVVVAVHDSQNRVLFGMAAPTTAVNQFRAGQIPQRQFLRTVAIQAHSRAGVADVVRRTLTGATPAPVPAPRPSVSPTLRPSGSAGPSGTRSPSPSLAPRSLSPAPSPSATR